MTSTVHTDTFVIDNLPPREQWPDFIFERPSLRYPSRLNCATELLDNAVARGAGDRLCIRGADTCWTYEDLLRRSNQIARVLVDEMELAPGNRVLLRGGNCAMMAACWFAVIKAGGIAVASMPLLRAKELSEVIVKARISHALCDVRLADELRMASANCSVLTQVRYFNDGSKDSLESLMKEKTPTFDNVDSAAEDPCLIAFTSGTTGKPKGTVHFHRDVLAVCDCWPVSTLQASQDDVFIGSPPLAFTFGLGGLLLFPMRIGASTVLLEKTSPPDLLAAIAAYRASVCFTAPTSYRAMTSRASAYDLSSLRKCVSAGEALPAATRQLWKDATGIELIDGLGTTEMLHIFISADEVHSRPGATGKPIPGYRACVMDSAGNPVPPGHVGMLAIKGPTGCRYLKDDRQKKYVRNGWNFVGDAFLVDADGYFIYQGRIDDMIVSAGYNIAGPEVEDALLLHPKVAECAVVGVADEERGQIVKAFVVLRDGIEESAAIVTELQQFVKSKIAPYKYPRAIAICRTLPRTATGKLQRFKLQGGAENQITITDKASR